MNDEPRTLPTSVKTLVILQLCLVFSVVMWTITGPFMGNYFTTKSSQLLYKAVIGMSDGDPKEVRTAQFFAALPEEQRDRIADGYQRLQEQPDRNFWAKSREAAAALFYHLPSFTQAWVFFSFVICLMLLLRIEGAAKAAWVLPLVALAYGIDNRLTGTDIGSAPDVDLFPSEEYVVTRYLDQPLHGSYAEQSEQLKEGWYRYLIAEWAHDTPSRDLVAFGDQVEKGEHSFHIARVERRLDSPNETATNSSYTKKPIPLLITYFLCNLGFALFVNRKR
jgi:hypothetical protein